MEIPENVLQTPFWAIFGVFGHTRGLESGVLSDVRVGAAPQAHILQSVKLSGQLKVPSSHRKMDF